MSTVLTPDEFSTIAIAALEEWELNGCSWGLLKYREHAVYEVIPSDKRFIV